MELEGKWINFIEVVVDKRKTKVWEIYNKDNGSYLGRVSWYPGWRKYCFGAAMTTVFEEDCLRDIAKFLEDATAARKVEREMEKADG